MLNYNNLSYHEFWKPLHQKFTGEMEEFIHWLYQYSDRIGHHGHNRFNWIEDQSQVTRMDTFWNLPIAFQIGVFIQYTTEAAKRFEFEPNCHSVQEVAQSIQDWFSKEHEWAIKESQHGKNEDDHSEAVFDGSEPFIQEET